MKNRFQNTKTLLKLTAITTGFISLYNQILIHNACLKNVLARSTNKKYYHSKNGNLFYTIHGQGSPLLLIHDLTAGGSGYEWNRVEKELAKNHTVYTIDLPGCGRSDKQKQNYTMYYYVQFISEFIKNVIGEQTDVITSGYSGSIAIMIHKQDKYLIRKMMLVNPCDLRKYAKTASRKEILFHHVLMISVFGTLIYHMIVSRENIDHLFVENYYYNPFHLDYDMEDAYYEASHRNNSLSKFLYASFIRNYMGCNVKGALRNNNYSDIFILFGESEPNCRDIIEQYQEVVPDMRSTIVRHTKHFPHVEKPRTFLNQVEMFFY